MRKALVLAKSESFQLSSVENKIKLKVKQKYKNFSLVLRKILKVLGISRKFQINSELEWVSDFRSFSVDFLSEKAIEMSFREKNESLVVKWIPINHFVKSFIKKSFEKVFKVLKVFRFQ